MNRRELVRAVAAHTGTDPKQVDATLTGTTDVITAVVAKGEPVSIQGFAKFTKVNRPARMARNPQTGEQVHVKAKTVAKATAMKAFRDTVMAPSKAPRLSRGVWPTDPDLLTRQAQARKVADGSRDGRKATAGKATGRKATGRKTTTRKASPARRTSSAKKVTKKKAAGRKATAKRTARRR